MEIKFVIWEDSWLEGDSLSARHPMLYSLCLDKNGPINMFSGKGWNLRFRRNLNDWNFDDFESLMSSLEGVTIRVIVVTQEYRLMSRLIVFLTNFTLSFLWMILVY